MKYIELFHVTLFHESFKRIDSFIFSLDQTAI